MEDRALDVLVVDDEESNARQAARGLEDADEGITGFVETDPETALGRATDGDFDCLLSAASMATLDGTELTRLLERAGADVPVVVVSGERSEAVAVEALRAGAADYLRTDHDDDPEALAAAVRRAVDRSGEQGDVDEFARMARHDLRNPLSVAKGWLQTYRESGEETHYRHVVEALERMAEILDDFEALTRADATPVERSPVDLAAVATAAWEIVDPADAGLRVDYDIRVDADPSMLQTVLENLFENAVEHGSTNGRPASDDPVDRGPADSRAATSELSASPAEGAGPPSADGRGTPDDDPAVTVEVRALDGDGFYVADDGTGIPPADRQQVFVRGHAGADGTGMGLSIVGSVAAAHGWDVSLVESESGGARFEFRDVPVVEQPVD
jgi:signal transduction histidine kinase